MRFTKRMLAFVLSILLLMPLMPAALADSLPTVNILSISGEGENGVLLVWQKAEEADGYYIYGGTSPEDAKKKYLGYAKDTFYVAKDLQPGKPYWFNVIVRKEQNGETVKGPFGEPVRYSTVTLSVTAVNCTINDAGDYLDFSQEGVISCRISAAKAPAYWIINGVKYRFVYSPSVFSIRHLDYPLVIEACPKGYKPTTLKSDAEIQAERSGDRLIVESHGADLCHLTAKEKGAGGWFREFDFTEDFKNRATKKTEPGGRVTLRCKAYIPKGKKIKGWEMNGAGFYFTTKSTEFVVWNLNTSMVYKPLFTDEEPDLPARNH